MILSDQTIREGKLVEPFSERKNQNGMSYGLGPASYDVRAANARTIAPGGFSVVPVLEYVKLPANIGAFPITKSTWLRQGIVVAQGWFDPGFEGHPSLAVMNHSDEAVTIKALDPIAQFVFLPTDYPVAHAYDGKYQGQGPEAQGALFLPQASIEVENDHLVSSCDLTEAYRGDD